MEQVWIIQLSWTLSSQTIWNQGCYCIRCYHWFCPLMYSVDWKSHIFLMKNKLISDLTSQTKAGRGTAGAPGAAVTQRGHNQRHHGIRPGQALSGEPHKFCISVQYDMLHLVPHFGHGSRAHPITHISKGAMWCKPSLEHLVDGIVLVIKVMIISNSPKKVFFFVLNHWLYSLSPQIGYCSRHCGRWLCKHCYSLVL